MLRFAILVLACTAFIALAEVVAWALDKDPGYAIAVMLLGVVMSDKIK